MKQLTKSLIIVLVICLLIVITTFIIVGREMKEAEKFCNEVVNGTYTFKDQFHYCNDRQIARYKNIYSDKLYWRFVNLYDLRLLQNDTED